jgi:hypothetical protein
MTLATIILAETDPAAKVIFITIFVLWVLGAIGKVLAGKSGQRRLQESLQRTRQAMEQDQRQQARRRMPATPPRLAPEIQRRLPPMMPNRAPMPRQAPRKPMRAAPIQPKRVQQIPQPQTIKKQALAPPAPEQTISPIAQVPSTSKPLMQASAPTLIRWLRPETLRQQFILTEIFQPPLALREQRK